MTVDNTLFLVSRAGEGTCWPGIHGTWYMDFDPLSSFSVPSCLSMSGAFVVQISNGDCIYRTWRNVKSDLIDQRDV